jgi:hypothetical protein
VTGQAPTDFEARGREPGARVRRSAVPHPRSLIRALLPAIAAGWVQVWALDPKRMELSFGRTLFHRPACQAAAMVELLETAVAEMHDRAEQFGGRTRTFTPSTGFPFLVILVDELAFLTAYQPERDLRKRAEAAIATLTSQGRSVGVCVVGALGGKCFGRRTSLVVPLADPDMRCRGERGTAVRGIIGQVRAGFHRVRECSRCL